MNIITSEVIEGFYFVVSVTCQ